MTSSPKQPESLPPTLTGTPAAVVAAYSGMTPRLRAFALAILTEATQEAAAIKAGYARRSARSKGNALAKHPSVVAVTNWWMGRSLENSALTIERLMQELGYLALSDPRELFDPTTNEIRPVSEWPEHAARSLAGIQVTALKGGSTVMMPLFHSKLGAIKEALKVLNAYPVAKQQAAPTTVGVVIVPARSSTAGHVPARASLTVEGGGYKRLNPEPALRTKALTRLTR